MQGTIRSISVILFITLPLLLSGQIYSGGNGDGFAFEATTAYQAPTQSGLAFMGGQGDGFGTSLSANFSFSVNKFYGGPGDGYVWMESQTFSYSTDKFLGSSGDGFASTLSLLVKYQSPATVPLPAEPAYPEVPARQQILSDSEIHTWPNPFSDRITIEYSLDKASVLAVRLMDMTGREVLRKILHSAEGYNIHVLEGPGLADGTYLLTLVTESGNRPLSKAKLIVCSRK